MDTEKIEILDDFEEQAQEDVPIFEGESWLKDWTEGSKEPVLEEPLSIEIKEEPIEVVIEEVKEPIKKEVKRPIIKEEKLEIIEDIEQEEFESKRSLAFIGTLFTILIVVIILLPFIAKFFSK